MVRRTAWNYFLFANRGFFFFFSNHEFLEIDIEIFEIGIFVFKACIVLFKSYLKNENFRF